jgi:hypothetical protein
MHEEATTIAPDMSDADRYGIKIERTRVFKGALPKPGHIFYVAKFNTKKHGIQEPYQVSFENEKLHTEKVCRDSVISQVVERHFTEKIN